MKASIRGFSLTQPWASLIGEKRVETRSWPTSYRGWVAIHASKAYPKWCRELEYEEPFLSALKRKMGERAHALPTGAIVTVAYLAGCERTETFVQGDMPPEQAALVRGLDGKIVISADEFAFGDYGKDRYGLLLTDITPLRTPIPCKGALGLWTIPDEVLVQVREQWSAAKESRP